MKTLKVRNRLTQLVSFTVSCHLQLATVREHGCVNNWGGDEGTGGQHQRRMCEFKTLDGEREGNSRRRGWGQEKSKMAGRSLGQRQ